MNELPKRATMRTTVAAALAAMGLTAGCGGEDRLSKDETAKQVNAAVQAVNAEFQQIFTLLGRRAEGERVPTTVREQLKRAAATERREAGELAAIEPPTETENTVDQFVRAAGKQADAIESAAAQSDLTVAEMADVVEAAEMRKALIELVRQGLAKAPPEHQ